MNQSQSQNRVKSNEQQPEIINLRKEGFEKGIKFFQLYCYLIKVICKIIL